MASGTLFRKDILNMVGRYNEDVINCGLENYELLLKMLVQFKLIGHHVNLPLFNYRIHNANMSLKRRKAIIDYGNRLCASLGLGSYSTNEFHPYQLVIKEGDYNAKQ